MPEVTITFTTQELMALRGLINLAVKAGGLDVAEPAIVLVKKIASHMGQANDSKAEKPERSEPAGNKNAD